MGVVLLLPGGGRGVCVFVVGNEEEEEEEADSLLVAPGPESLASIVRSIDISTRIALSPRERTSKTRAVITLGGCCLIHSLFYWTFSVRATVVRRNKWQHLSRDGGAMQEHMWYVRRATDVEFL
jgi:hypothetical protein